MLLFIILNFIKDIQKLIVFILIIIFFKYEINNLFSNLSAFIGRLKHIKYKDLEVREDLSEEKKEEFKEIKEEVETSNIDSLEEISKENFRLKLEKQFEYAFRIIYKTQINLLKLLKDTGEKPKQQIQIWYHNNVQLTFPGFNNWNLDNYLLFLKNINFIEEEYVTNNLKITKVGELFLMYIEKEKYDFTDKLY